MQKLRGKGRRKPGVMNQTEEAYSMLLKEWQAAGLVRGFWFEALTLKLADDTRYTPDFLVMMADDTLECHEVKGFWRDDAKVKIKVAASMFPFKFVVVKKQSKKEGGGWDIQDV